MELRIAYNASEDQFPLPEKIRSLYGPFGFPEPADTARPYVSSNFVMSLDGKASFRELKGHTGGSDVSRSALDRWLMDFLRVHHDAQLIGASTLREEPGPAGFGFDYAVEDEELRMYRRDVLKMGPQKIIVVTNSGNMNLKYLIFNSEKVQPWIITGIQGEKNLRAEIEKEGWTGKINVITFGEGNAVNLKTALRALREKYGVRRLLCEGGPSLYGELLSQRLLDEDFRTISLQVLGDSTDADIARPTTYGHVAYTPATAPWFSMVSLHYSLPYHAFIRLRYAGPRRFPE